MKFRILGPIEIHTSAGPLSAGPPRQRCVLAAMLVDVGRPVRWETIVDRAWGQHPPPAVRRALYVHISRLRHVLNGASAADGNQVRLERRSTGYVLDVDPDDVDLHRFRRLVALARDQGSSDRQRAAHLRHALALWRGAPLADLDGDWVARMREAWSQQRISTILQWAETELRLGNAGPVIDLLGEVSAEYPLIEPLTAVLMRALFTVGRVAEALDCYTRARQMLVTELGINPGSDLQELHRAVLRSSVTLASAPSPSARSGSGGPATADPGRTAHPAFGRPTPTHNGRPPPQPTRSHPRPDNQRRSAAHNGGRYDGVDAAGAPAYAQLRAPHGRRG
jgi:DNA-binding SARP family transcriptional activator